MCRDVWVWASSDFPSMHLRWWQACCKKNFKGGVKKIWHLRGPALMVLSLLCQTEDKIFISHYFVSTLEKRFCRFLFFFFTIQRDKVSRGVLHDIFQFICLCAAVYECVRAPRGAADQEMWARKSEKQKEKQQKKNAMKMEWDLSSRSLTVSRTYLLKSAIFPRGL